MGILRDITEQQRAQAALQESEERYRTLFHSSRDAMMTLVPPAWTFTSANPAAMAMFGLDSEKQSTRSPSGQLSPNDSQTAAPRPRRPGSDRDCHAQGLPLLRVDARRADGETFPSPCS